MRKKLDNLLLMKSQANMEVQLVFEELKQPVCFLWNLDKVQLID